MDRTASDVCIGMNFVRENPEVIVGILVTTSQLILRNPETEQVDLVSLEESEAGSSADHEEHGLSNAGQRSLCCGNRESYRLLPEFKAQVLAEMGDLVCTAPWICMRIPETAPKLCIAHHSNPVTRMIGHASNSAGRLTMVSFPEDAHQSRTGSC